MIKDLSTQQKINREYLLNSYPHLGSEFTSLVLQHYDLKTDPDMFNHSATSVQIVRNFYTYWHRHIDGVIDKYGKHSGEAMACSFLLVDTCTLGVGNYCSLIINTSKQRLGKFLIATNGMHHLDLCRRLFICLRDDFLLNDEISEVYNKANDLYTKAFAIAVEVTTRNINKPKEGCYVATMVYQSYDAPQVIKLREFRDMKLKPYLVGRLLIRLYYALSPKLVEYLTPYPKVHRTIRKCISIVFNLKS